MEQQEGSPSQDPVGEDELAEVLANMGEYGQPSNPLDLHDKPQEENAPEKPHAKEAEEENMPIHDKETIRDTEQEQSVPNQKTPEEFLEEAGEEKEVAQELTEPVRVPTPEQPKQNNEEKPQKEDPGTSHGPGHSEQLVVPSN